MSESKPIESETRGGKGVAQPKATMNQTATNVEGAPAVAVRRVVSRRGHVLHTIMTCPCDKESDSPCCVCDMELAVCRICGAAECELDERDCTGESAND